MKWKKGRKRPMNEQQKTPKQPEEDMTPDVTDQEQPAAEAPQEPAPQADAPDVDALKKAAAKADEYLALAQRVQADLVSQINASHHWLSLCSGIDLQNTF